MTRRGRGPQHLDDVQLAALDFCRKKRIERDNAVEVLEAKIAKLRSEFLVEYDEALASAVQSAAAKGVPHSRIKRAVNVSDHRTYRNRFFSNVDLASVEGWDLVPVEGGRVRLDRFLRFNVRLLFELQFGEPVVVPKPDPEYDEAELALYLEQGKFEDEWSLMRLDLRSLLRGESS